MGDTMEKQWHYAKNGQTGGPVAESTIVDMIAAGELGPKDHVWNPECADWLPIERSPFAKACGKATPPAAPASSGAAGPGSAYGSSAQSMRNSTSPADNPGAASSAWGASSGSAQNGASSSAASAWEKLSSGEGRAQKSDWQSAQSAHGNPGQQEHGGPSGQWGHAYGQGAGPQWGAPTSEPMGFVDAVKVCLTKKFATFTGRASRSEFWWFTLFHWLCAAAASLLGNLFGGFETASAMQGLVSLALLLPALAVFVRRMHDINKSGWFYLLIFIPIIGWIILLIWLCRPSDQGPNRFGA